MSRVVYAVAVVMLVGGSAVMASGIDRDNRQERSAAIQLLAGMQR